MTEFGYKAFNAGRRPTHGVGQWAPPGKWTIHPGPLVPCKKGLHLCRDTADLLHWLAPEIWIVEYDDDFENDLVEAPTKIVVRAARLVERTAWTPRAAVDFADDCSSHLRDVAKTGRCLAASLYANTFRRIDYYTHNARDWANMIDGTASMHPRYSYDFAARKTNWFASVAGSYARDLAVHLDRLAEVEAWQAEHLYHYL